MSRNTPRPRADYIAPSSRYCSVFSAPLLDGTLPYWTPCLVAIVYTFRTFCGMPNGFHNTPSSVEWDVTNSMNWHLVICHGWFSADTKKSLASVRRRHHSGRATPPGCSQVRSTSPGVVYPPLPCTVQWLELTAWCV